MVVRYPVHRRRRDVYDPLYPVAPGRFEDVACPLDVRGIDVLGRVEWQGCRGVYDKAHAFHCSVQDRLVANVALYGLDLMPLWVVELLDVQRDERVPLRHEITD